MKKFLVSAAVLSFIISCNSNSETKKTEDTTATVDKVENDNKLDTAGQTQPQDLNQGSTTVSDADRDFVLHTAIANNAEDEKQKRIKLL